MSAGAEALDFIRGGVEADVMLLDIRMPIMSGLEVMAEVAASPPPYPIVWRNSDCPLQLEHTP
jgi:CheY-like chemotaxis protein